MIWIFFRRNDQRDTWRFSKLALGPFGDHVYILRICYTESGALSGNKTTFEELGGSIHKQRERREQHTTAVQHSSLRHYSNAPSKYRRLPGVG